jgi:hypothetical protein
MHQSVKGRAASLFYFLDDRYLRTKVMLEIYLLLTPLQQLGYLTLTKLTNVEKDFGNLRFAWRIQIFLIGPK